MITMLPPFLRLSKIIQEIIKTEDKELNNIRIDIKDLENQMFVKTATWGLKLYEKELGIRVDENKPIEERRSIVLAKMRASNNINEKAIQSVAENFKNGQVSLKFQDGSIIIYFNDVKGKPKNTEDIKRAIEEIIPAHLGIKFEYIYNSWGDFLNFNWQDISKNTWGELSTLLGTSKYIQVSDSLDLEIETKEPLLDGIIEPNLELELIEEV